MRTVWYKNKGLKIEDITEKDLYNLDKTLFNVISESIKKFREKCIDHLIYLENLE